MRAALIVLLASTTAASANVPASLPPVARTRALEIVLSPLLSHPRTAPAGRALVYGVPANATAIALGAAGLAAGAQGATDDHVNTAAGLLAVGGAALFAAGRFYHRVHGRNPQRLYHLDHVQLSPMMVGTSDKPSTPGLGFGGKF